MFAYRIEKYQPYENKPEYCFYIPQYQRRAGGVWHSYLDRGSHNLQPNWNAAYSILEQHATPAQLASKFIETD